MPGHDVFIEFLATSGRTFNNFSASSQKAVKYLKAVIKVPM